MSNKNNKIIQELNIEGLKDYKFRIPLYQRKYAWSKDEVNTLLEDLLSFNVKKQKNDKYFIGNIVVEQKEDGFYDIIDGQQRLTTIYLIAKITECKNLFELHYEIRPEDDEFLKDFKNEDKKSKADNQFRENIDTISRFQKEHLGKDKPTLEVLLNLCKIALTILPDEVDIVKYFEVMNNRGRQLEKHQILKANLLKTIKLDELDCHDDKINYAKIWDYCSNMNVYIEDSIYYGDLKKDEKDIEQNAREPLFKFLKGSELPEIFKTTFKDNNTFSISKIIDPQFNPVDEVKQKDEFYIRQEYGSIVKFSIFLIQVLKIFLATKAKNKIENSVNVDDIVVNDRYLLNYFYKIDDKNNTTKDFLFDCSQSKEFIKFLLKMRILYDYFIFKRDDNGEPFFDKIEIQNKQYKVSETQELKSILMLQLLFNFSAPQYFAQDWLSVALKWLNENIINNNELKIDNNFYISYFKFLENFDRELAKERLIEGKLLEKINNFLIQENTTYDDIKNFECKLNEVLHQGTSTPHYWFYKLDYLLWKKCCEDNKNEIWNLDNKLKFQENDRFKYSIIKSNFRLSRLNSIEHIHPQSKQDDWKNANGECQSVDCFGNLALISNHMNSALNAQEGQNKMQDIQKQLNNGTIESLKMILVYSKYEKWTQEECDEHQKEMIDLLCCDLELKDNAECKNEELL